MDNPTLGVQDFTVNTYSRMQVIHTIKQETMKKLALTLLIGLFALTACTTTEADLAGPFESREELVDAINTETELDCGPDPVENNTSDDSDEDWNSMRCADGGILHYLVSEGAKDHILDYLAEYDTSKTRVALGEDWIFVGEQREATTVRDALNGRQPSLANRSPLPSPTPTGPDFEITCHDGDGSETGEFTSPQQAWDELSTDERADCKGRWGWSHRDGAHTHHDYSDTELEALGTAEYDDRSLSTLYGMCAESHLGDHEAKKPWSEGQLKELNGALILCPDHPEREIMEDRTAEASQAEIEREQGERFGNGTYRVGEDIQPGTYVVEVDEPFDGCYWQRLDAAGDTIENNFINSGYRAEVTIAASDYSFNSERCGEWVKQ